MTITIDTHTAVRKLEAAGADAKLAEAIVATVSRADAEIATKFDVEAVVNRAIVQIILAQLLIAGVVVAFLKLSALRAEGSGRRSWPTAEQHPSLSSCSFCDTACWSPLDKAVEHRRHTNCHALR